MGDVGDVNAQEPAPAVGSLQRNRVVEIPSVGRVDRDDRPIGQVRASFGHGLVERLGLLVGLGQGILGEVVGQLELADDRQRVDARLAQRPEHLGDHAFAVAELGREADHVDHHLVVVADVLRAGVAHGDRLGEHRAVDANVADAARSK